MPNPSSPYALSGHIYASDGTTAIQSATVTARNIRTNEYVSSISVTNSAGEYTLDLANFPSGYANGDVFKVLVYKPEKFAVYDSVIDTSLGFESKNITTATVEYTGPGSIASFMGVRGGFSAATNPHPAEVCKIIMSAQTEIETRTNHAWREVTVNNEQHSTAEGTYFPATGRAVYLQHRMVRTLDNTVDKIEYFNGSTYEQWQTTKTEGRASDFWFEYEKGVLHILFSALTARPQDLRITYRYGETTVPADIEMAAKMLAAAQLLSGDDRTVLLPSGESTGMSFGSKIAEWMEAVDRIIHARAEISVGAATNLGVGYYT